jgi:hypothetical protein
METRRIAFACFVGGSLCCTVALMFAPIYWWLGLIAGVAGGYVSYEFREVCKAIPLAMRATRRGSVSAWDGLIASAKAWLSRPHPFGYPAAALAFPVWVTMLGPAWVNEVLLLGKEPVLYSILFVEFYVFLVAMFVGVIGIFALIGARISERCYWVPTKIGDQSEDFAELCNKGYREVPLTYAGVFRWSAKGFGLTIKFFAWTLWKYLAIKVWAMICFFGRFAWHLFKLIHSDKRLLCAIDGTIGGAVAFIWLTSAVMSFPEQVMFVIFGGLFGAAFGLADWKIVSKRILRIDPQ